MKTSFIRKQKDWLSVILLTDALDMQQAKPAGTFYYIDNLVKGLIKEGIAITTLHYKHGLKWSKIVSSRWIEMKQNTITVLTVLLSVSILFATLLTLPRIDTAQPDPYFHVKATPIAYWIGFSLSLILVSIFSILLLKQKLGKSYKFLGFFSLLLLAVYIYVIPRLMYVNNVYTDAYQFVSEVLYVLRYGHVGFGFSIETPALSCFVAQFSLVTGVSYTTVAEFFPMALPFISILYLYMITRLIVGKHAFFLACLTFIALNWFLANTSVFNRQSFSLILMWFTWYLALKFLLIKRTPFSWGIVLMSSYFAVVISHAACPLVLTINIFGFMFFVWLIGFKRRHRSSFNKRDPKDNRKLLIRAFLVGIIFLFVWLSWQVYTHGALFMAVRNAISAFQEFLAVPDPSSHISSIISIYTNEYYPIVNLRLFEAIFMAITGSVLTVFFFLKTSRLKNIVLSSWFISTYSLNVYVLYVHGWILRPIIYSIPSFSLLLTLFSTLSITTHHRLAEIIMKTAKVILFGAIISFAIVLPLTMYCNTPFMFPPTSYLKELNFITKHGNGSVVIFGSSTEFGYYVLLNNASVTPVDESQFFDPDLGFQISRVVEAGAIATSFRVYTKDAFVFTQPSMMGSILEMENCLLTNPGFSKIYDVNSWHKVYARQFYFNYSKVLP